MNLSINQIDIIMDGLWSQLYHNLEMIKDPDRFAGSDHILEDAVKNAKDVIDMMYQFAKMKERKLNESESKL